MGEKYEVENEDEFINITAEGRAALQGPKLYLVDTDKLKKGHISEELYSKVVIRQNQNCIDLIVYTSMLYWGQTNRNW